MQISVFGLGYVGTVSAACLAHAGHTVVGVDIDPQKVASVDSGQSPILEPEVATLIRETTVTRALRATGSTTEAIQNSELSLVCVGTPSQPNGGPDLRYVCRVCEEIGAALRAKTAPHVVVLRSTMLPGSTEEVAIPLLLEKSGRTLGVDLFVYYNPEFLREGSSVHDFYHPPQIVIGQSEASRDAHMEALYQGIAAPMTRTSIRAAEMVKYAGNAFHALKVCFANELGNLAKRLRIDSHDVMRMFCQDTVLNISPAYLRPGFAFGGSCLPKDLRALIHLARKADLEVPVLNAVLTSNSHQVTLALDMILALQQRRIGFVGMSFKPDTDDIRESPLVELIERLIGKGFTVRILDTNISLKRLVGSNRRYVDEHLPHLASLLVDTPRALVDASEVIVLGHRSAVASEVVQSVRDDQFVIDLVRVLADSTRHPQYEGMCW